MLRPLAVSLLVAVLASGTALADGPRHVSISAGPSVSDCYIWEEQPALNHNSDTLYVGLVGATDKRALMRFELPPNVDVLDARLELLVENTSGVPIRLHELLQPWTETQPTWNGFVNAHAPTPVTTFTPVEGRVSVDLTQLARAWANGRPNNGFVLMQDTMTAATVLPSSERSSTGLRPALELVVENRPAPVTDQQLATTPVPKLEASCGVQLRYPLATHVAGATTFSSSEGGPEVDAATGELVWTPTSAERGLHMWTVTASDGTRSSPLDVTVDVKCGEHLRVGCGAGPGGALAIAAAVLALRRRKRRAPQRR